MKINMTSKKIYPMDIACFVKERGGFTLISVNQVFALFNVNIETYSQNNMKEFEQLFISISYNIAQSKKIESLMTINLFTHLILIQKSPRG